MLFASQLLSTTLLALVATGASAQFSGLPGCVSDCVVEGAYARGYDEAHIERNDLSALCEGDIFPSFLDQCLDRRCENDDDKSNALTLSRKALECSDGSRSNNTLPACVSTCLVRTAREGGYAESIIESGKLSDLCTNENFPSAFDGCLQDTCESEDNKSNGMRQVREALGCSTNGASSSSGSRTSSAVSSVSSVAGSASSAGADVVSSVASKVSSAVEQPVATGVEGAASESGTSDASNVKLGLSALFLVGGAAAIVGF